MDSERLKEQARTWRKRAEREHGDERLRSLALAQSYEALARSQEPRPPRPLGEA